MIYIYIPHLAQAESSDSRRSSSTVALQVEPPVTVPVLEPAQRTENINTYQYGIRDGVWNGVVRDQVGIDVSFENVVRFEFGELGGPGDSRVVNGIGIKDASSVDHEFPK